MRSWETPEYKEKRKREVESIYRTYERLIKGPLKNADINYLQIDVVPADPVRSPRRKTIPNHPVRIKLLAELCMCDKVKDGPTAIIDIDSILGEDEYHPRVFIEDYFADDCWKLKCEKEKEVDARIYDVFDAFEGELFDPTRPINWKKVYVPP